jgi:diacylglycerol kinase (ATP)
MYCYIIDPSKLNQKTFERVQSQLYSSLSEFKINGEIMRSTSIRSVTQLVEVAFQRGVKTLVAVGDDETLHDVINVAKDRDVTFAYIPLADTEMGRILGLNGIEVACKSIAQRRVEQLDLGLVNGNWFFTRLSFGAEAETKKSIWNFGLRESTTEFEIKFSADGKYSGSLKAAAGAILNARDNSGGDLSLANPTDSVLDLMMVPQMSGLSSWRHKNDIAAGTFENIPGCSVVHLKKVEITSPEGIPLRTGDKIIAKTPAIIEVLPKALRMIVGKDRTF